MYSVHIHIATYINAILVKLGHNLQKGHSVCQSTQQREVEPHPKFNFKTQVLIGTVRSTFRRINQYHINIESLLSVIKL